MDNRLPGELKPTSTKLVRIKNRFFVREFAECHGKSWYQDRELNMNMDKTSTEQCHVTKRNVVGGKKGKKARKKELSDAGTHLAVDCDAVIFEFENWKNMPVTDREVNLALYLMKKEDCTPGEVVAWMNRDYFPTISLHDYQKRGWNGTSK